MLVSAFAGHELTMRAYREAVEREYRFFSYGDAMVGFSGSGSRNPQAQALKCLTTRSRSRLEIV